MGIIEHNRFLSVQSTENAIKILWINTDLVEGPGILSSLLI